MPASPAASMHLSISASCVSASLSVGSSRAGAELSSRSSTKGGNGDATCRAGGAAVEALSLRAVLEEATFEVALAARSLTSSKMRKALDRKKRSGLSSLGPTSPLTCLKSSAARLSSASNAGRNSRRKACCCCSTRLALSRCKISMCPCCALTAFSAACKRSCKPALTVLSLVISHQSPVCRCDRCCL